MDCTARTTRAYDYIMGSDIFRTDGHAIDICQSIDRLCRAIEAECTDSDWVYLGEYGECTAADLLIGAFWALTEWHGGQWSPEYSTLSSIGSIYSPNYSDGPEPESGEDTAYELINSHFESIHSPK